MSDEPVPPVPLDNRPWQRFLLTPGDQWFIGGCTALLLAALAIDLARRGSFHGRLVEVERLPAAKYEYRLDINRATWVEWAQLEGIGETLARRIVAYREEHGPFQRIQDLLKVRGIGAKTLENLSPWLYLEPELSGPPKIGPNG